MRDNLIALGIVGAISILLISMSTALGIIGASLMLAGLAVGVISREEER